MAPSSASEPGLPGGEQVPHVISPALRRRLQQCYEHGTKLAAQETYDFDYAHTLFGECAAQDPGNLVYVEAMLANLGRKYGHNKRGSRLAIFGGKGPFKKAAARKNWAEVLRLGPEALKSNPWDSATLRGLAEACAAYSYAEVELRYLRQALDASPKDPDINRHSALTLMRLGNFDQAIACWHRVEEARPQDPEPPRMISDLQTEKTRMRTGLAAGESGGRPKPTASVPRAKSGGESRPSAPRPEPSAPGGTKRREIQLTPRQQLEQFIALDPADVNSYLQLADLHLKEQRLVDAHHVLTKALAASGNAIPIQEKLEDVDILRLQNHLAVAERRAAVEPSDEAQRLVQQLRAELLRVELDIYARRSQRYPEDAALKFELGVRLKQAGNDEEALFVFQTLRNRPEFRLPATFEGAECNHRLKRYAKALQLYQQAAELAERSGDAGMRKQALLRSAALLAGLKDVSAAEKALREVLRLDPACREAQDRLDKIHAMGDKEQSSHQRLI